MLALGGIATAGAQAPAGDITLSLRTRDPKTSQLVIKPLTIDPHKVGIVIVDPWNYHWCMTWTEQAGGMTPRLRSLNTSTTQGVFRRTAVSNSCEFMRKPPSPVTATTRRFGCASFAATAPGTAMPIEAKPF